MTVTSRATSPPEVSVVIPTRDRRARLVTALQSALAQQEVDFEVLVVDDGSTDGTANVVQRLADCRVRLVRNETPLGESGARNRGIAEARGAWVAFLDDDDLWAPDKLIAQLRAMRDAGRSWAYAGEVAVDDQLQVIDGAEPLAPEAVMASLPRYNAVPGSASNVVVSARLLARAGMFDRGLRRTADWDMWLRFAREGPPACVPRPLVAIRMHAGNMSRDMDTMLHELEVVAVRHGVPVDRARHYRWAAWQAMREGRRGEAVRYYARAALAGDLRSLGRAAVVGAGVTRSPAALPAQTPWTEAARRWVAALGMNEIRA